MRHEEAARNGEIRPDAECGRGMRGKGEDARGGRNHDRDGSLLTPFFRISHSLSAFLFRIPHRVEIPHPASIAPLAPAVIAVPLPRTRDTVPSRSPHDPPPECRAAAPPRRVAP